jgi:hypothetical protein
VAPRFAAVNDRIYDRAASADLAGAFCGARSKGIDLSRAIR